jgi:hypothetical protein
LEKVESHTVFICFLWESFSQFGVGFVTVWHEDNGLFGAGYGRLLLWLRSRYQSCGETWNGFSMNSRNQIMKVGHFVFVKLSNDVLITVALRVSVWMEERFDYLMPCEFKEVVEGNKTFVVKTNILDPGNFLSEKYIEKKFLFGHPGKMIGYGILKKVEKY